ncbi:potassium transporter KefB [Flavobacterium sp.]|uniref:potassium transporter KefB n=1 Tax=Flavobacterium sp. TaxID=239 RepID=UPI00262775E0|nr:potassium transporter KefB [Flavobacterium sp.]
MTQKINLASERINSKSILKRMLLGAGIGLVVISIFIFPVKSPNPDWGKFWMVKPLIITPLAVAFGSLVFFSSEFVSNQSTAIKIVVKIGSVIAFIISIWLGIVLGLNGTLWN